MHFSTVRKFAASESHLAGGARIISISMVENKCLREMRLPEVRRKGERLLHAGLRQRQPFRRLVEVIPIKAVVRVRKPGIRQGEIWVAPNCFIEEADGFQKGFLPVLGLMKRCY